MSDDKNRPLSFDEARHAATAVVYFYGHNYWFSDCIHERLAEVARGKSAQQAADAMDRVLATERHVPLHDDPHDGWRVVEIEFATKYVPAPVSDPNSERSSNLSVPTNAQWQAKISL